MRLILLLFALLCAPAAALVPVRTCTNTGTTTTNCSISVAAHHLVTTMIFTQGDTFTLTYTDTLGHSASQNPFLACQPSGTPCNAGVTMADSFSIAFASQSAVLFYISTGSSSGSVTFTVGGDAGNTVIIYVGEYAQDFIALDAGDQTNPTITTTGANDLIIVITGDSGVVTCSSITPASGFTAEYTQNVSCKSYTDIINVAPGVYSYRPTLTGSVVPGYSAVAIGVAPFVSSAVRHARNLY